jgi:DNA-binding IclR family transcriptional regulator
LAILRSFEDAPGDLGVTELAQRAALSVSTAHRLTRALCAAGLLHQDPRTERYQLGPALVVLGRRAEEQLGYTRALPALQELAAQTGESVNLGIRADDDVLVVLDVASDQPLRFDQAAGTRVPIHTSAMGKSMLAFAGDPAAAVSKLPRLARATARTITSRAALLAELTRIRKLGWAMNDEERHPGVRAVAAPVLGPDGIAFAAIAVQGPAVRVDESHVERLAGLVRTAAVSVAPLLTRTSAA